MSLPPRSSAFPPIIALMSVAIPLAVFAPSAPGQTAAPLGAVERPSPPGGTAPPRRVAIRRPSPMMEEIQRALVDQRRALEDLEARAKRTSDDREALAIERQIEQVKRGTEIRLLQIQAGCARREGRMKTAEQIEQAIRALGATAADPDRARHPDSRAAAAPVSR